MTTKSSQTTVPGWAEFTDDILESVEADRAAATEAVRKFVDEVTPVVADQSRRKAVANAALDLAEQLIVAQIEFARSVVRSAGYAVTKG